MNARLSIAFLVVSFASLVLSAGCGGGLYGYSRTYEPLDDEEEYFQTSQIPPYADVRRDPASFQGATLNWFGVVKDVRRQGNRTTIALSHRAHWSRHLCADREEETCRVTVQERSEGDFTVIVDLRSKFGHIESEKASITAGAIMVVFLFVGEELLKLMGVDVNSFAVAGSFVLFFLALEMILGIRIYRDEDPGSASIVPLAFPLIAGATASGWAAGPEDIVRYEAGQEAFAKGVLVSAKATAERAGVAVETIHIADRWPADAIVEVAAMRGCDLIVMASHGRRGLGRLLLGSQTAEVLAHSKIPVLVVR